MTFTDSSGVILSGAALQANEDLASGCPVPREIPRSGGEIAGLRDHTLL